MIHSKWVPLLICIALTALFPEKPSCLTITIDPDIKYQKFEGWGTSLCWWAVLAGKWNEKNRNELIGAIVDPDTGLGYTCFRYNIGGGDQAGHTHLSEARAVPGFKTSETSQYDWTADQNQRNILLGINNRGKNLIFEAFSNSPPWWMTISGCVSGNTNGTDNLKPAYFPAFAEYLATVVQHYKETWGITFRTVEPFNEPSSGYWKINGGQEGCGFKSQQSRMIKELGKQLISKNLFPQTTISAADETSLEHTVTTFKSYDDSAYQFISQINSHSYGGWNSRSAVASLAKTHKKNLWQSESGPLGKGSDQSDITMWMSHVIIQDLRVMKANAWIDWQVCDPVANWMTIELNHSKQTFKYTKRFYMHAAFSRFIRPGSQIISSNDTNSVAALDSTGENLIIVLRNHANTETKYSIYLTNFETVGTSAQIVRFALPGSLTRESDITISNKQLSLVAPKFSLTTCIIPLSKTGQLSRLISLKKKLPMIAAAHNKRLVVYPVSESPYHLSIYNSIGRRIVQVHRTAGINKNSIDLNEYDLRDGMYIAELKQNGYEGRTTFILKNQ